MPLPKEAPHKISTRSAKRFQRRRSLKLWSTDDGRTPDHGHPISSPCECLHDHLARFRDSFLSSDHSRMSVNDMWVSFKSEVLSAIPSKMTKTKYSLPWIDSSIKRLIRKRDKLYFRARKSSSPDLKNHYNCDCCGLVNRKSRFCL